MRGVFTCGVLHHVEHGSGKAHASRAPRVVEQALAQLVYINFNLHGESSYRAIAAGQTARPN